MCVVFLLLSFFFAGESVGSFELLSQTKTYATRNSCKGTIKFIRQFLFSKDSAK